MTEYQPSLTARMRQLTMPGLLCGSIILAGVIALLTVTVDDTRQLSSPGGYTWSLGLWYLPVLVLVVWFLRRRDQIIQRPAFWTTLIILLFTGFALDYFFANTFFVFPNQDSTLLPTAPARGEWVPLEEYLFYVGGFLFVLMMYIWCDEDFLLRYNVPDYRAEWQKSGHSRILGFDWFVFIMAGAAIVLAWIYKATAAGETYRGGFPGYFTYLAAIGVAPAMGFLRSTRRFINWRAFSVTFLTVVLISILWEATLAAPLGWWFYRPEEMVGIVVRAWSDLPVEAVLVWLAVTFTTVIVYEAVKVWQASGGGLPKFVPRLLRERARRMYNFED